MCVWPKTSRSSTTFFSSSSSSSAGSGANERTSETGDACQARVRSSSSALSGSAMQRRDEPVAELLARGRDGAEDVSGRLAGLGGPALAVAADPDRGPQLEQAVDGLARGGAEERDVAADEPLVGAAFLRVGDDRVERGEVAVDVVEDGEHGRSVPVMSDRRVPPSRATADLALTGPTLRVRIPRLDDAAGLFAAASDPEVTRWFSWGPYESEDEARAYLERLPGERERGVQLDLVIEHVATGEAIGIIGFSEIARRDRRATIGTWLGRAWWGTGANREAKALMCHLGFELLGLERIGSYTNVDHARSQRALEKLGFEREGVLRAFHRHGDDDARRRRLRPAARAWETGPLRDVPVAVSGEPPPQFVSPA